MVAVSVVLVFECYFPASVGNRPVPVFADLTADYLVQFSAEMTAEFQRLVFVDLTAEFQYLVFVDLTAEFQNPVFADWIAGFRSQVLVDLYSVSTQMLVGLYLVSAAGYLMIQVAELTAEVSDCIEVSDLISVEIVLNPLFFVGTRLSLKVLIPSKLVYLLKASEDVLAGYFEQVSALV